MDTADKKKLIWIACALILVAAVAVLAAVLGSAGRETAPARGTTQSGSSGAVLTTGQPVPTQTQGADQPDTQPQTQPSTRPQEQTQPSTQYQGQTQPSTQPQQQTQPTTQPPESVPPETTLPPVTPTVPEELEGAPTVTLPVETDPSTGEELGVKLPCEVPDQDLLIQKIAPYSGIYVEDGTNRTLSDVAMMLVTNTGTLPVEYTIITAQYEGGELLFHLSTLPAGASAVVQAQNGNAVPEGQLLSCAATVIHRGALDMAKEQVSVTDNGDGSLTVTNLTGETIPAVRVFYKYYMEEEQLYVGGISFTAKLTQLAAGDSVTVRPAHFSAGSSRVMMVAVYETDQ